MTEHEELEEYNREFNERCSKRTVKNLITCYICKGKKGFLHTMHQPEWTKCQRCKGTGYLEHDPSVMKVPENLRYVFVSPVRESEAASFIWGEK